MRHGWLQCIRNMDHLYHNILLMSTFNLYFSSDHIVNSLVHQRSPPPLPPSGPPAAFVCGFRVSFWTTHQRIACWQRLCSNLPSDPSKPCSRRSVDQEYDVTWGELIVLWGAAQHRMVLHNTAWCCTTQHGAAHHSMVLHNTAWCCTTQHDCVGTVV